MLNLIKPTTYYNFLKESQQIINELTLNVNNSEKIVGSPLEGYFTVDGQTYNYIIRKLDSPFIDKNVELTGEIYNIAFWNTKDLQEYPETYQSKGGRNNIIKIYSTMYKVILDFANAIKPDYFIIAAMDSTNYFPIYSDLTKNNKIPGYHRKTVVTFENYSAYPMTGIAMAKDNISEEKR